MTKRKRAFSKEEAKIILKFIFLLSRYIYPNEKKLSYLATVAGLDMLTQCDVFKLDWTGKEQEKKVKKWKI